MSPGVKSLQPNGHNALFALGVGPGSGGANCDGRPTAPGLGWACGKGR